MIQRIQTIFLLIADVLGFSSLFFTAFDTENLEYTALGSEEILEATHYADTGNISYSMDSVDLPWKYYSFAALIIIISASCTLTIFFFKKRKLQMLLCKILLVLVLLENILVFFFPWIFIWLSERQMGEFIAVSWNISYSINPTVFIIPILQLILIFLALRAIKKDEELVRSTDRLR
ncbi:MAG: DUF4293 family protein [Flavobacteriales bacterium]